MRTPRLGRSVAALRERGTRNVAFALFCAFIISYFGRLARRVPLLGMLHLDFVLAALALVAMVFAARKPTPNQSAPWTDPVAKRLWILLGYIVVTIPFVEWPGSVLHNLENYLKSVCFFFLVVATVDTTRKLGILLAVYVATQVWRVMEPLYLHVTSGYWGDITSLGNWEYMDRLSGSPYDIINPNGLAFVVIMTLPMLQFLVRPDSMVRRLVWTVLALAMCYALVLSASRSGFLALVFLCLFAIWRSKHRAAWFTVAVAGAVVAVALMTNLQRERYISIFSHSAPGAATAEHRISGVIGDFEVSLRRPLFGHGIGTSQEANAHFRDAYMLSHDLYTETAEELGYVGLVLVLALLWSFLRACWTAQQVVSATPISDERLRFLHDVARSLVTVVAVDLFFSFAAYGLNEPYWYFIGGLSVVTGRLAAKLSPAGADLLTGTRGAAATRERRKRRALHAARSGRARGLGARQAQRPMLAPLNNRVRNR
jgi:putative inorganic carbon (hco3(-)) transporter